MRVGFVGTENSHVKHFIRFLNVERRHPGFQAVVLAGGESEHNRSLAEFGGISQIVKEPADLLGHVDIAVVCNRDGAQHLAAAEPLLRAGVPVLVDKPLAASTTDAQALLQAARDGGTRLFSASALRFVPEMEQFLADKEEHGPIRHLHVVGPADPDSEYSGLSFYGIHHVEAACQLLGNPVTSSDEIAWIATRHGGSVTALCRLADVNLHLTFMRPGEGYRVPFHATAVFDSAVTSRDLTLGPDYNAPALDGFLHERWNLTEDQLLTPVALMEALMKEIA